MPVFKNQEKVRLDNSSELIDTPKSSLSLITLIGANLIPLIGALFFDWNAVLVLALFWIENLIIGSFNILKLIGLSIYKKASKTLFITVFFIFHYGAFCTVHGILLWDILNLGELENTLKWPGIGQIFAEGVTVLLAFIEQFKPQIWLGITALILSHCVSFIENFILRGEIFRSDPNHLMAKPYSQIMVMHIGLILGAFAVERLGSPIWLLVIIITFKVVIDIRQHRKRHHILPKQR